MNKEQPEKEQLDFLSALEPPAAPWPDEAKSDFAVDLPQASVPQNPVETPPPAPDKQTILAELAATCGSCTRCVLHKGRTHSVFFDGNPEADIMIIGEGPGYHEDQSGIPFVGKAGQLLTKILASVGLNRAQDTYIANVVKCRPPNNRTPTPQEMAACVGFLKTQIRTVQPKLIILAGGTAVKGLIRDKRGITRLRGQWLDWDGIPCMPIFHPSYLLRNESRAVGSPKWQTWQDMKNVMQRYHALNSPETSDSIADPET